VAPRSRRGWRGFALRVLPLIAFTAAIVVGGSWPQRGGRPGYSDKVLHAVVFGLLVPFAYAAFGYFSPDRSWTRRLTYAFLYSVVLGGLLEVWQGMLRYRSQELLDWVADAFGALSCAALVALYVRLARSRGSERSS
jgi:VanZ family protein